MSNELDEFKKQMLAEARVLHKSRWRFTDIRSFFHCGPNTAMDIKRAAIANGGKLDFDPISVSARAVLALFDTTPEEELLKRAITLYPADHLDEVKAFLRETKERHG